MLERKLDRREIEVAYLRGDALLVLRYKVHDPVREEEGRASPTGVTEPAHCAARLCFSRSRVLDSQKT